MQEEIAKLVADLRAGKPVVFPTETVYALAVDAQNAEAVAKIYALKGRDENKPLAVFPVSLLEVEAMVEVSEKAKRVMQRFMPGPITCVLPLKETAPLAGNVTAGTKTLGVRMPDHPFALALLKAFAKPLVATSVNHSGEAAAVNAKMVRDFCAGNLGYYAPAEANDMLCGKASTVVDLTTNTPKLLREGGVAFDDISAIYQAD